MECAVIPNLSAAKLTHPSLLRCPDGRPWRYSHMAFQVQHVLKPAQTHAVSHWRVAHGSHRPGKVMEFNPWLEKSLNFMLTWKNGILPGKVIENQRKSLKNCMYHVKVNLNMKILMIIWFKISFCHYISDQIGEAMLSGLLSRATCYIVADSWTTCYIVWSKPKKTVFAGKASRIKAACQCLWGSCGAEHYIL